MVSGTSLLFTAIVESFQFFFSADSSNTRTVFLVLPVFLLMTNLNDVLRWEQEKCSCRSYLCVELGASTVLKQAAPGASVRITRSREIGEVMTGEEPHPNNGCSKLMKVKCL